MSPVAVASIHSHLGQTASPTGSTKSPTLPSHVTQAPAAAHPMPPPDALDIGRHPSPWHEIAHTLSATPTPSSLSLSRRGSSPVLASTPLSINNTRSSIDTSTSSSSYPSPLVSALSSSQALRDWEARLASPDSDVRRHQLVHPPTTSPHQGGIQAQLLVPASESPVLPPKLAAERDKEGHIEYKLKLIDPTPERFGKLVTQMMWRLKQGKNEAIYEIGLADDGTVVGLTRGEMDASLKTLELMASELGATVMILREIVLSGAPPSSVAKTSPAISDTSSALSDSHTAQSPAQSPVALWPVRRPDLDHLGRPKKGTRSLIQGKGEPLKARISKKPSREVDSAIMPQYTARQVVFSPEDGANSSDSDVSAVSSPVAMQMTPPISGSDDDIPPFDLELEDPVQPAPAIHDNAPWRRRPKKTPVHEQMQTAPAKSEAKRLKLAKRREERRMDLLRGDGMSPGLLDLQSTAPAPAPTSSIPDLTSAPPSLTTDLLAKIPHQPARPSSLRLASPAPSTSTIRPSSNDLDQEGSLWGLSQTPLDSLSLSFADVQIQNVSPISSPPSSPIGTSIKIKGDFMLPPNTDTSITGGLPISASVSGSGEEGVIHVARPLTGKEMVCVEALVVRKVQHGHGVDGDGAGSEEEEECGWGGQDDVWGLSVDSD